MTLGIIPASTRPDDYPALVRSSAKPLALVETRGAPRFIVASQAFIDSLHVGPTALTGRAVDDVLGLENGFALAAACRCCLTTADTVPLRVAIPGAAGPGLVTFAVHRADGDHVIFKVTEVRHGASVRSQHAMLGDGRGPSMTYINDLESGHLRYADDGLAGVLGLDPDGVHSAHEFKTRIHPDDQVRYDAYEAARAGLSDGVFIGAAIRLLDTDGDWRLISFRARVLRRSPDDRVLAMLGSASDITDAASAAAEALGVSLHRAEENERARIGRELHDSVSQYQVAADLGVSSVLRSHNCRKRHASGWSRCRPRSPRRIGRCARWLSSCTP